MGNLKGSHRQKNEDFRRAHFLRFHKTYKLDSEFLL